MKRRSRNLVLATIAYRRAAEGSGGRALLARKIARLRVEFWNFICGSDIEPRARLAADLALPHPNGVVMHEDAVVAEGCMIMQQVTLGQLATPGAPQIGSGVYIGAGAKVLGAIRVGDGARIGAKAACG